MILPLSRVARVLILAALATTVVLLVGVGNTATAGIYAANSEDTSITLAWTAPGDDRYSGRAVGYDLRYSDEYIGTDTANWWHKADSVINMPSPAWAGQRQTVTIDGLISGQKYFFALRTYDDALNWSPISNVTCINCLLCGDLDANGKIDIKDLMYFVNYYFLYGPSPFDVRSADVHGNDGIVNISDLARLVGYLFQNIPTLDCGEVD